MAQMTFDRSLSEAMRDRGMRLAEEASDEEWKARFRAERNRLAESGEKFTVDDIRKAAGPPPGHPSAIGALMMEVLDRKRAAKKGLVPLEVVGYARSARVSAHSRRLPVYRGIVS